MLNILEVAGTIAATVTITTAVVIGIFSLIDDQSPAVTLRQHEADLRGWLNRLRLRIALRRPVRGRHARAEAAA